jgi:hypothetical protein
MLSLVFPKPCLPLLNVGRRIVGIRKIRDNVSPGDSPDFREYTAADIVGSVGWPVLYDHSRIIRMLNQKLDQGLKRPIIANEINPGWVWPGAVLGPWFLNHCIRTFVAKLREGGPRCGIKTGGRALVVLGAGWRTGEGPGRRDSRQPTIGRESHRTHTWIPLPGSHHATSRWLTRFGEW